MRLVAAVLAVALASAAAETGGEAAPDSRTPINDILQMILKELEGEKELSIDEIKLAEDSRLEKVSIESSVDKISLAEDGKLHAVKINNTTPVKFLRAKGLYKFQDLTLPGGLTIYGNGEFRIRFEQLTLSLYLQAKYSSAESKWTVKDVALDASLKSSLIEFDNLMDGEPLGDFVHKMINQLIPVLVDLAPALVQENKTVVMQLISDLINKILGDPQHFLKFL